MILRDYDANRDREAAHRIWREVGWLGKGEEESLDRYIDCGRAHVAELNGVAECLVLTAPGTMRYLKEDLPLSCVTGVTTSRIARRQGLAGRLTAKAVATDAAGGALVTALGMFDQGFYNRFGFGSGSYDHAISFDPGLLEIPVRARIPQRMTIDDWEAAHAARLTRKRGHGGCNVLPAQMSRMEMRADNDFGLGYRDEATGAWTHYFWSRAENMERGPYSILWMVYHTKEEFLELMALIRDWGDQVRLVKMAEPAGIQMQDFLREPFKHRQLTGKSNFEAKMNAHAYWQARILDLPSCLTYTHLHGEEARFNLRLSDLVERFLDDSSPWRGVGGDYVVTLGPNSHAEPGLDSSLPTLSASVGAFSRLWLGVRPAGGLSVTDDLSGPPPLLEQLDRTLCLPPPIPDWEF